MRILGIDHGDARIGIAVSDPLGLTAQSIETISWKNDINRPINRIKEIVESYDCEAVVVGLPRNMNGTVGPRELKTREFMQLLESALPRTRIIPWDERLTTVMAQRAMHNMGIEAKKQKGKLDQIAASFILQGYLDSL